MTSERDRRRHEIEAAAALLLLGRHAKTRLKAALWLPLQHLPTLGARPEHISMGVRRTGQRAITAIRVDATSASAAAWARGVGLPADATPYSHAPLAEEYAAQGPAASLGRAWDSALGKARAETTDVRQAIRAATEAIQPNIERTAITETVDAWNAEVRRRNAAMVSAGFNIRETWRATLDTRTCPRCAHLHGETRDSPDTFDSYPPLHPRCQCFIETEVIS